MKEYNFFRSSRESDKETFFGPLTDSDMFIDIQPNWTMAHVLFHAGLFPSMSEAKRQNNGPIPKGFTDKTYGRRGIRVTIFDERIDLEP